MPSSIAAQFRGCGFIYIDFGNTFNLLIIVINKKKYCDLCFGFFYTVGTKIILALEI